MKKTLAGLGVLALVALGATGVSFPATAVSVQPVAEIAIESDAISASPDAVLKQAEPVVATVAAPVAPVERVAPVVAPAATVARVAAPEAVQPIAVAPAVPVAPVCEEDMPCWDCATMGNLICGPVATVDPNAGDLIYSEVIVPVPNSAELGVSQPTYPDCANLKMGDAWAGVSLVCGTSVKGR